MVPRPPAPVHRIRDIIPLATPNLCGKESEYVAEAISRGYIGPSGPFVERFEDMVAKASGRKWAVATITGTAAIHAAMSVIGGFKSTIAVPEMAFPAARNVLGMVGAEIVSYVGGENHDCAYYRHYCVADRAPAIGEPPVRSIVECYSFAANKTATCGHGGAIVGDDSGILSDLRVVIHQGRNQVGRFNYRMADLNAAVGCAQMEKLDEFKARKREIWNRYRDAGIPMMERGASRWMSTTTLKLDIAKLKAEGIETREECGGTSLPCSTHLTVKSQDEVIRAVLKCGAS